MAAEEGVPLVDAWLVEDAFGRVNDDWRAATLLEDGEARRESVFRNADLRFGGGDGILERSSGSAGSFAED